MTWKFPRSESYRKCMGDTKTIIGWNDASNKFESAQKSPGKSLEGDKSRIFGKYSAWDVGKDN